MSFKIWPLFPKLNETNNYHSYDMWKFVDIFGQFLMRCYFAILILFLKLAWNWPITITYGFGGNLFSGVNLVKSPVTCLRGHSLEFYLGVLIWGAEWEIWLWNGTFRCKSNKLCTSSLVFGLRGLQWKDWFKTDRIFVFISGKGLNRETTP